MTSTAFSFDETLVVIVLYKDLLAQSESFKSLSEAIPKSIRISLFVFDNSPTRGALPHSDAWDITYQHEPSNIGVSLAYNEAFKLASQLQKKWLLLADQDTKFPATLFSDYQTGIEKFPNLQMLVPFLHDSKKLLSPFKLLLGKGIRTEKPISGIHSLKKFKVINSGILISLVAFARAKGYDERFPLDYSDIVFCDRLLSPDSDFVLIDSECHHNFSGARVKSEPETLLTRFIIFCNAVLIYKKISIYHVSVVWIIFPRALKLFFETKNLQFIKTALRHYFK